GLEGGGQGELWSSSQGHLGVGAYSTELLGMKVGDLRVYPAEIGGAFGGKTVVYVEPVAVMLARKSGHPVKVVMSREDVFRATGPTSGSSMRVKIGVKRDGTIVAADGVFKLQAGAFPGSPFMSTCGAKLAHNGYAETIQALLDHPGYKAPLGKNQGRGVASGYWFNGGGESSATVHVNDDGTVVLATGSPDIGGSRASMAIMAAEMLGVDYDQVRPIVADTASV